MTENYELETGNKLLLLQAISSIEHGLSCLEWMCEMPNENTKDAIVILKDRFAFFKECVFSDTKHDYLIIDKAKQQIENLQGVGFDAKKNINDHLSELKRQIIDLKK